MISLSFPDINVWLSLTTPEHLHHAAARRWWKREPARIGFSRFTQIGFLRLMTTPATMGGKPLAMTAAWQVYDRLFEDGRVSFFGEPASVETYFRINASGAAASPKFWADAYLAAFAERAGGAVITFDRALAGHSRNSVLLTSTI